MPFLALGDRLVERGHRAIVLANDYFSRAVARHPGLEFRSIGTEAAFHDFISGPAWGCDDEGWSHFLRIGIMPTLEPLFEAVSDLAAEGVPTVVVAANYAYGARAAASLHGLPTLNTYIQPAMFAAHGDHTPGEYSFPRAVKAAEDYIYSVLSRGAGARHGKISATLGPNEQFLGLWPSWFKAPEPHWSQNTALSGFPLIETDVGQDADQAIEAFLSDGTPPVGLFYGSFRHDASFFERALQTCRALNQRALVICRYPERLPSHLTEQALVVPRAPFGQVFPRLRALIHHGGIGTVAQAITAGIPQLCLPEGFEQPDNAGNMADLGVGSVLPKDAPTEEMTAALETLLSSQSVADACRLYASRMADDNPWDLAVDVIEDAART